MGKPGDQDELVFENLKYSNLKLFFVSWLAKAKIDKNITFHSFRHTDATLRLELGTDIYTISKLPGHKHLKSTQVYTKIPDKKKKEAALRIMLNQEKMFDRYYRIESEQTQNISGFGLDLYLSAEII